MAGLQRVFPPASDAEIKLFEKEHSINLPPYYRNYLMSVNGGQSSDYLTFTIPSIDEKVILGALYGISDEVDNGFNLRTVLAEYGEAVPNGYLLVGEDPGGNQLLLATSGEQQDGIYFRDRVGFLAKRTGKSLFLISVNINDFIGSLRLMENT